MLRKQNDDAKQTKTGKKKSISKHFIHLHICIYMS